MFIPALHRLHKLIENACVTPPPHGDHKRLLSDVDIPGLGYIEAKFQAVLDLCYKRLPSCVYVETPAFKVADAVTFGVISEP